LKQGHTHFSDLYNYLLIRYGEIGLKGKNRRDFENRLVKNIKTALRGIQVKPTEITHGRMFVPLPENGAERRGVAERLQKVFGIVSISPAIKTASSVEAIQDGANQVLADAINSLKSEDALTFKVETRRADKSFPVNSMDMSKNLGAYLLDQWEGLTVDVKQPQLTVWVEIREGGTYIFSQKLPGPGGLPVGSTGKGIVMLSGGIDSPVASWLSMKRGIEVIGLHFHSYPFTSERSLKKVEDLAKVLAEYGGHVKLYVNHFTEIQKAIQKHCDESMWVTVMRRFMFKIAREIAHREQALAIVTGENVGQVASQTLESMQVVSHGIDLPILRPLAGYDKKEIMELAGKIGTYDISVRPYEDCCTLFLPKNPKTRPKLSNTQQEEGLLPQETLIQESLEKTEIKHFRAYEDVSSQDLSLDIP